MLPDDFWQHEPADTIAYINSRIEANNKAAYNEGLIQAQMMGVTLANSFRSKGATAKPYPTFGEMFESADAPAQEPEDALERRVVQLRAQYAGTKIAMRGHSNGND